MNATVAIALVTVIAFVVNDPLAQVTRVLGPLIVFGAIAASFLRGTPSLSQRIGIALSLGFGITVLLVACVAIGLPHVALSRPLTKVPLAVATVVPGLVCAAWCVVRGRDPVRATFAGVAPRHWVWAGVLSGISMLSLIGLGRANHGVFGVSIAAACVALVLVALAIALPDAPWTPPKVLLLMTAVVMAGWLAPLRGGWLSGGDLPHEYYTAWLAISQGRLPIAHYHDSYGWMLSLTAWPALWHAVAGLSLLTIFGILPEIALACCVLVTWGTVREHVGARTAASICALFVVAAPDLVSTLPLASRQCYALVFLALLVYSIATTRLSVNSARVLALASILGTAVTHYSTAFVAAVALVCAWGLSYMLRAPARIRVLSMQVAVGAAAAVVLWDIVLAGANSNLNQLAAGLTNGPGSFLPKPVAGPGIRCTATGAQAASFVHQSSWSVATLVTRITSIGPAATPASTAIWVLAAAACFAIVTLALSAWHLHRGDRTRGWVIVGIASLVPVVALGAAGVVRAAGLHRVAQLFSRPFTTPAVTPVSDVARVRADDLFTLTHAYYWMRLANGSCTARLLSNVPPMARGTAVIGAAGNGVELVASKVLVLLAVISVAVCVWAARKDQRIAGLAGLGIAGIATAAVWKLVPTMAQYFGTDRIQVETYLIFAATAAVAVRWIRGRQTETMHRRTPAAMRTAGWVAIGIVAAVALGGSVGLINLVTPGRPLDAAFSARGQQADLSTTTAELPAARWLVQARPRDVVQADSTSLGALSSVGYADRYGFIPSVDPVLTDERAWVFASRTNLEGRAYGGSTTYKAAFRFPIAFLEASRPTLYVSNDAVVFGASADRRAR